jgi:uncharacterized membrane protein YphA (DoxX/SURF4 family)
MNIVLWIIAGVLAAVFIGAGAMKLTQPKQKLADSGLGWVQDVSAATVKLIGGLEVLAAIGLIVPPLLGIAPVLAPVAAVGIALLMIGAAITHGRRREPSMIAINVALFALAAILAWGRFAPYAFSA